MHVHCYRADEILMMIRLAEEMGFKVATFQHVLEGYKVAKEIGAHGAGASTFSDWWGYKIEAEDAIPGNAAIMTHKGVNVSINSDSAEHARRLNTEAAKSVRWGRHERRPGVRDGDDESGQAARHREECGSLEVGKDADVVIWSHHPLSTYAIVERTYIDGILYYDRTQEVTRLEMVAKEKAAMPGGRGAAQAGSGAAPAPGNLFNIESQPIDVKFNAGGPTWSITNARIVPVTGPVIEKGTIVIRGNRIQALGANVSPTGTRTIDARGANVYPGFIDGSTDLG